MVARVDFTPGFAIINQALERIGQANEERYRSQTLGKAFDQWAAGQQQPNGPTQAGLTLAQLGQQPQPNGPSLAGLTMAQPGQPDPSAGGAAPQTIGALGAQQSPSTIADLTPSGFNPAGKLPAFASLPQGDPTAGLIQKFEGYRDRPYWDVNAYRVGYGSDTITDPNTGQVRKVTPNDRIDRSFADADLARRIPEFQRTLAQQFPGFDNLAPNVRAALTSVGYNYGSLPKSVVAALNTGDMQQVASAVRSLSANPDRRAQEADFILRGGAGGAGAGQQVAQLPVGLDASAQASGAPTQLGSTGGRGLTNPLPGAGQGPGQAILNMAAANAAPAAPAGGFPVAQLAPPPALGGAQAFPSTDRAGLPATRPQPQVSQADLPMPGAQETQAAPTRGFLIPSTGQVVPAGQVQATPVSPQTWPVKNNPANVGLIKALLMDPGTRQMGMALWQQALTGKQFGFQVVGDQLYRTDPNSGIAEPIANPRQKGDIRELNGRLVYTDPFSGSSRDITPQGMPSGYRPMTDQEKQAYGIPPNTGAFMGPDGKPATMAGTSSVNVDTKGETEEAKALGKGRGERAVTMETAAAGAPEQIAKINLLGDLLARGSTGALGPAHATVVGFAQALGVPDDRLAALGLNPQQAVTAEAATKIINELVVGSIGKGGFPANNFSDADRIFLTKIWPSISNRPDSNAIALEVMRRVEMRKMQLGDAWIQYQDEQRQAGKSPSVADFEYQQRKAAKGQPDMFRDLIPQAVQIMRNKAPSAQQWPAQQQGAPPVQGARQAPDGNWYVSDPNRPGKFLQVQP